MSEDWSELRDVDSLTDGRVRIDFTLAIADLPRLRSQLASGEGRVTGQVRFGRDRGVPVVDVEISARAELICQRCLAPFACPVECGGRVAMVADAAEAERVPEELETILAPGHRISVRDLVEEELLLALPIVPLHAGRDCPARGQRSIGGRRESPGGERHRPFERLDELFKRRP